MQILIRDRSALLNEELSAIATRRLQFALSRFANRVETVQIVISDENGPRGGKDMAIRTIVHLNRSGPIVIQHRDSSLARGLSLAAERVGRAVGRAIEKHRQFARQPLSRFGATADRADDLPETVSGDLSRLS